MDTADLAWAAGLFDGEGCISVARESCIVAQLGMTDAESVWRFARIVGVGIVRPWRGPKIERKRPVRVWYAGGKNAIRVIEMLSPWLSSVKLADFDYAKRHAPHSGDGSGRAGREKTHCLRGHEYTHENTHWGRSKYGPTRSCRKCQSRWQKEYQHRLLAR